MVIGEMWAPQLADDSRKLRLFPTGLFQDQMLFFRPPLAQHFVDGYVVKGKHVYYYDVPVKVWGTDHVFMPQRPRRPA